MLKKNSKIYKDTKFAFDKKKPFIKVSPETMFAWTHIFYKTYPGQKNIPIKYKNKKSGIYKLIMERKSQRNFSNKSLSLEKVTDALYYSVGIKKTNLNLEDKHQPDMAKRMYPSGGARYPVETYLVSFNIKGLKKGIYHFNVKDNVLETLIEGNFKKEVNNIYAQDCVKNASALLILTAVLGRSEVKYFESSFRLAFLESGHIGQNIQLLFLDNKIGTCPIGGCDETNIAKLLELDLDIEIPTYHFALGPLKK